MTESFVPIRIKVRERPELMARFEAQWTPTVILRHPDGREAHRIEGFLEADDFLAQLLLGLGHLAFQRGDFEEAERRFAEVLERLPQTDAAPEAQYWRGVARYKRTNDAAALTETARAFEERYGDSVWAKKASIWRQPAPSPA